MRRRLTSAVLLLLFGLTLALGTLTFALESQAADIGKQTLAANDGWGSYSPGTTGGAAASSSNIFTVTNRKELVAALGKSSSTTPKIVYIKGTINLSVDDNNKALGYTDYKDSAYDLQAYLKAYDPATWGKKAPSGTLEDARDRSQKKQAERVKVAVPSNVTIVGLGNTAKIVGGGLQVNKVKNVIIRNIFFEDAYDYFPAWDPTDGSSGNWNSEYDNLVIEGSTNVWVDHNSFSDGSRTDNLEPIYFGHRYQRHDGLLDVKKGANYVTVSYNHFFNHQKLGLVGSSDGTTSDDGKLKVTFHHNLYENVGERAPRVRYGQVHLFNNYYKGDTKQAVYPHSYSIGVGKSSKIYSQNNYFQISNVKADKLISVLGGTTFYDTGSLLNGSLANIVSSYNAANSPDLSESVGWKPTLYLKIDAASSVPQIVGSQAGAGKL